MSFFDGICEGINVAKIVPPTKRNFRQKNATTSTSIVNHAVVVAIFGSRIYRIYHVCMSFNCLLNIKNF